MTDAKTIHKLSQKNPVAESELQNLYRPETRMRRLRRSQSMRDLVRETSLSTDDLVLPVFVEENLKERKPIASLPGIYRESEDSLTAKIKDSYSQGLKAVMLFGVSHHKDNEGRDAMRPDGLLARMIDRTKQACPEMLVIADTCFCEYTDHGHCGPLNSEGDVDNDRTLDNLAVQAAVSAQAGADIIAPSGMMDGMVGTIRSALDQSGYQDIAILSYAAKYASGFYGPFRDAAGCSLGEHPHARRDRKSYQMDPGNTNEALREVELDLAEGADMVMVKPGLPYLDILYRIKSTFSVPTFAYNVSGEYAMIKAAAKEGLLDYETCVMEMLTGFKRAGADGIISYAALDAASFLNK